MRLRIRPLLNNKDELSAAAAAAALAHVCMSTAICKQPSPKEKTRSCLFSCPIHIVRFQLQVHLLSHLQLQSEFSLDSFAICDKIPIDLHYK